ncbi:hypothetical protein RCL_jg17505.t1 [Rhizophagus clarus]|uniref:Uncharacterized protein n=1 Tax=Rhizophagus clarus TaxID=94130 RepID=A0A8H3QGN0_9GLOM|nr:hypothetical protein RCL_jg17505.t1 [Rhizophagus clarus]
MKTAIRKKHLNGVNEYKTITKSNSKVATFETMYIEDRAFCFILNGGSFPCVFKFLQRSFNENEGSKKENRVTTSILEEFTKIQTDTEAMEVEISSQNKSDR